VRNAKCSFEQELSDNIASNPKRFWKYVQSKPTFKQSVCSIQRADGSVTINGTEIANVLNDFFGLCSFYWWTSCWGALSTCQAFRSTLFICGCSYWDQLCKPYPSKSGNPNGCHPLVFREVKEGLLQPSLLLLRRYVFRLWPTTKTVKVTPSFKKGCKTLPTNYHPVSLTSIVCKILETIVKEHNEPFFS